MATYHLTAPLKDEDVERLNIGDVVYISGEIFTCRSRLHRWVIDEKHPLPQEAENRNVLIHVGPVVIKEEEKWKLISFMPTSSIRFEKWGAAAVEQWNLKMIIGKTTMGKETMEMMKEKKCVHVSPQCVSPNLWLDSIKLEHVDLFQELGSIEATWYMELNELGPFIVDIDSRGNNLYLNHEQEVDKSRDAIFEEMGLNGFEYTKLY